MTEKINRRGVKTPDSFEPDPLQATNVIELMTPHSHQSVEPPFVYTTDDAGFAAELMGKHHKDMLLVLDNKQSNKIAGKITAFSILKYYSEQKQKDHNYDSPGSTKRIMVRGRKWIKKVRN